MVTLQCIQERYKSFAELCFACTSLSLLETILALYLEGGLDHPIAALW